jgi:DNA-binding transcriptional MocR family regulator
MTSWPPDRHSLKRPVYRSLVNLVARVVETGELMPGTRLPTHRDLAHRLGISVQTVSRAYEELIRRGLIVGEVGRGTFVRPDRSEPAPPFITERGAGGLIDLSILKPVGDTIHIERMKTALAALHDDLPLSTLFSFRPSLAHRRYREVAVEWLRLCGLQASPSAVLVTNGASPGLTIALMSAARPGDAVATEEIGHHMLRPQASYLGLRLKGLPIDDDGILPDALDQACASETIKALFLVPSAANPTVAMVSRARREAIVEIARRHNLYIIENDAWGPLVEDRPPPIASLAPERTFYVTSFTKCGMPGLRTGYLVAPDLLLSSVATRHLVTNWSATSMVAEIATRWVADGTARELLHWQRAALKARNALAAEVLGDIPRRQHPNSLHIWLPLPSGWREDEFVAQARLHNVAVAPGASFAAEASVRTAAVRISVGATTRDELRQGLEVVARMARAEPEPALLAI